MTQPAPQPAEGHGATPEPAPMEGHGAPAGHMTSTEVPAAHKGGMPQLDFGLYLPQIFWVAVALFVLYRALSRRFIPELQATLDERRAAISGDLEAAAAARKQAEAAEQGYQKSLADARARAQATLAEAKAKSDAALKARLEQADAAIAEKTAAGEARINEIRDWAARNVTGVAQDTAGAILDKFMPGKALGEDLARAVAEALAKRS